MAAVSAPSDATRHKIHPTNANMLRIFQRCSAVDAVFFIGLMTARSWHWSGSRKGPIGNPNADQANRGIPVICGGTEFGINAITAIGINAITALAAVVRFYDDRRRLNLPMDPAAFGAAQQAADEGKILNEDGGSSDSDNEKVEAPGKLEVDDFIAWKEGLRSNFDPWRAWPVFPFTTSSVMICRRRMISKAMMMKNVSTEFGKTEMNGI
jgi:hypothetical protein